MKDDNILTNNEETKRSSPHVLLVDDEEFLVKLWRNVLEKRGYKVTGYTDVKSALEDFKLNSKSFDIVITDQSMPNMKGSELVEELFKIRSDIKIIICTGYLEDLNMKKVTAMGNCEFLLKPFDNSTLVKAIKEILL
jgi:two-component system, cell cycle sensor histidine kinase and response regulator CckA